MTTVSPDGDVMRPCVAREGKERERDRDQTTCAAVLPQVVQPQRK